MSVSFNLLHLFSIFRSKLALIYFTYFLFFVRVSFNLFYLFSIFMSELATMYFIYFMSLFVTNFVLCVYIELFWIGSGIELFSSLENLYLSTNSAVKAKTPQNAASALGLYC